MKKKDVQNREDLRLLMKKFYGKVKTDDCISVFFNASTHINWDEHIETMCDFWENVLFYTGDYEGNPLDAHRRVNKRHTTTPQHFACWRKLFESTLKEDFSGPNTKKMITHSRAISEVMQAKI